MQNIPTHRHKLPLISPGIFLVVSCFAAGICRAEFLHWHGQLLLPCLLLLSGLLFCLYKNHLERYRLIASVILGILFFLLGMQHAETRTGLPHDPQHIYNLIAKKQTASLDGILRKYPSVAATATGPETRLLLQLKALHQPSGPDRQSLTNISASGLVLLTLKGLLPDDLKPGDRFLVKTVLSPVSTYSTPGSFNYKKHLANQGIYIKGWVRSPGNIIKIQGSGDRHSSSFVMSLQYIPERIRFHIGNFLDKTLSQPARGLYKAILIGDRRDVPAEILENFTITGCIHILAISGMHMGLLALVTIAALIWILKRSTWLLLHAPVVKIGAAVSLLPLFLYSLIAGFNTPVLRAFLMTSVFILALLFDRPENLINHILAAAIIILIVKPAAIFSASFQLSFSAVIAIAFIYPMLYNYLCRDNEDAMPYGNGPGATENSTKFALLYPVPGLILKWFLAGFALTAAAMIGTFPLLLFHFNRISLLGIFTNLLVEPLICLWALVLGLAASICIPIAPALAKYLFIAGSWGLTAAERICSFFAAFPYASLWFPTPSPLQIIFTYFLILCAAAAAYLKGRHKRYAIGMALFFLFYLATAPVLTTIAKNSSDTAAVTFLDVGHGSSTLLRLPGNRNILVDGGGAAGDRFNMGARVIAPFLWQQQLRRIDTVVVTHPHADHYNGLPFILKHFQPQELWINGAAGKDDAYRELLALAAGLGIETKIAGTGDILYHNGSTRLICLNSGAKPAEERNGFRGGRSINPNDLSIVLRLETNNRSFLLPADISAAMAEKLISNGKQLKSDVMMAPHHGSASSMSQRFIDTVAPDYIAISAGRNNPFNFPAQSFYDLAQRGIEVLTTGKDGTITFTVNNGEITASSYQVN